PFHGRRGVRSVHAGQRHVVAHQPAADLQRAEVSRHHDHPAAASARRLDVLQAFDRQAAPHRIDRAPPGAREFEQAGAQRGEVRAQQRLARRGVQFREAQRQVACGHFAPVAQQHAQQRAQAARDGALPQPGQARGQRHQADAQPRRPVARRQRRRGQGGGVRSHAPIVVGGAWRDAAPARRGVSRILYAAPLRHAPRRASLRAAPSSPAHPQHARGADSGSRPLGHSRYPVAMPAADKTERLLRGLYSAALYLLVPVTVYHLIWRGFRQEAYFERWSERYARYATPARDTPVWVHAVSVGEVNAVAPLVNALLEAAPERRLLVTTITPTGSARV